MKVKDLRPNVKNPRKMSLSDKHALKVSLEKFGDLGCVIENETTKTLVAGHQRISQLDDSISIKITEKYKEPTATGTIAVGYIESNGEQFKFRRVRWDQKMETEALLAANKHSGEWDRDLLKISFSDFPDMDLESIGFNELELEDMGIDVPTFDDFDNGFNDDPNETDSQYLKKNKGREEYHRKEQLPNTMLKTLPNEDTTPADVEDIDPNAENPFDGAGKSTDVIGKRHVLIIDLKNDEDKKNLKEKIRPLVDEVEGKFF